MTSLATGILSVVGAGYVPFSVFNELQAFKASTAEMKASNSAVFATVMNLAATVKKLEDDVNRRGWF